MLRSYSGVLKIDGEVGEKKAYDPRSYLKKATAGMKERVVQACADLRSTGTSLGDFQLRHSLGDVGATCR